MASQEYKNETFRTKTKPRSQIQRSESIRNGEGRDLVAKPFKPQPCHRREAERWRRAHVEKVLGDVHHQFPMAHVLLECGDLRHMPHRQSETFKGLAHRFEDETYLARRIAEKHRLAA